jgi:hypothetical protein
MATFRAPDAVEVGARIARFAARRAIAGPIGSAGSGPHRGVRGVVPPGDYC